MGIIKAVMGAVGGGLADSWLEVIEPSDMGSTTVFAPGVLKDQGSRRNSNTKGTANSVSNGSIIHVYDNQMMILVDGGAVVDYTAEPGYFKVQNSSMPSMFNGQFGASVKETFNRIKFGGVTPSAQRVFYINLKEMPGIKFGTKSPVSYYDPNYDIDVKVRAFGTYSIGLDNPLEFYKAVIPTEAVTRNEPVDIAVLNENRYISEFLGALQQALTEMSIEGIRISQLGARNLELAEHMSKVLDEKWRKNRGMYIKEVGIANIDYDDDTKELLKERNKAAIYQNANLREAMVQTSIARGLEAAGSNANGAMAGFMGVGMGMNATGGFMQAASATNMQQMQMQQAQQPQYQQQPQPQQQRRSPFDVSNRQPQQQQPTAAAVAEGGWTCSCGRSGNTGKFCAECGSPKPVPQDNGSWTCPQCNAINTGKFCAECGTKRPELKPKKIVCDKCGYEPDMSQPLPKFCPECGDPINDKDFQ
ncbi:MAG: SPFH domain-containing protein [Clostridia bacterium]|nr:SPFH domain-containing protein [Clostridia bacterium]